uniref:wall-associated receptor kinase-like 22 n=1 Tax=Erigeron canadensis TaxID=72917 RepID=UPI001CB88AF2|nr:wall-associated receptor kinase-like 22 [Erigeron canadensis]
MKSFQTYCVLTIIFLTSTGALIATPKYAKPGCQDMCGNVRIPYPFGIGASCFLNKWYSVDCNLSTPYLSALNYLQVTGVDLGNQTVTVATPTTIFSDCQNPVLNISQNNSINLDGSPFLYSRSHNKFIVEGCGNAVISDHGGALSGCSTSCLNDSTVSDKSNCLGVSCCQTTIPYYLRSYNMNLTLLDGKGGVGSCGSAFLVDKNSYDQRRFSDPFFVSVNSFIPVSLLWTLSDIDYDQVSCCGFKVRIKADMGNGTVLNTWKCSYSRPVEGNNYLEDGCVETEECTRCKDSRGYCTYDEIYDIDGLLKEWNFTCNPIYDYNSNSNSEWVWYSIYIGILLTSGLGFIAIIYVSYKLIKKRITRRRRKSVFKRINGRLLLKQQEEVDPSLVDKTILFTSRQLERATDHFNENRILGRGGQGTVYKGMLVDGRIVAVKKSKVLDESQLEQFINEVVILSQVNHRNVVKLLGCCLETEVPLLVSEFISNGTLYDRLHNNIDEFPFSLNMRLQIATEVAGALAYLHSATLIPIFHRDIKTTNILLDDKYRAKVSDFGTSRLVSMDQTHLTTLVKGTFGYLDPEYFQSSQFTEKSDVYSFGVVLVELITGEKPILLSRSGEHRSLATYFTIAMEEGRVMSIFDAKMIREATRDELLLIANLALRCLNLIGKNRPTMKEVAVELETIRTSHIPSTVRAKFIPTIYGNELSMQPNGESTSTIFLSFNDSITHIGR